MPELPWVSSHMLLYVCLCLLGYVFVCFVHWFGTGSNICSSLLLPCPKCWIISMNCVCLATFAISES